MPIRLIKDAWPLIKDSVKDLFNKIYTTKQLPEQWKTGRTIPLFKKGDPTIEDNYRPITNLCSLAKVFERAILRRIQDIELELSIDLTGKTQHGFKVGRSTMTAALSVKRSLIEAIDKGRWAGLVSIDLSAAFDVVNHGVLITRIENTGLPKDLVSLIENWLNNRLFYVEVGGRTSMIKNLEYGTIQGSVLGPVLFSLYMAPLLQIEELDLYADDNYLGEQDKNLDKMIEKLQSKTNRVTEWLKDSGLKVNADKTEFVVFHANKQVKAEILVVGKKVTSKSTINVLGITFDENLTWANHINHAVTKTK